MKLRLGFFSLVVMALPFCAAAQPTRTVAARTVAAATSPTLAARPAMSENKKITLLIQAVEDSGLKFIRNGTTYDSKKAAAHLREKYNYALKRPRLAARVAIARDFIKNIASASSISDRPYQIVLADGTKVPSGEWLTRKLVELEKTGKIVTRATPAPTPAAKSGKPR